MCEFTCAASSRERRKGAPLSRNWPDGCDVVAVQLAAAISLIFAKVAAWSEGRAAARANQSTRLGLRAFRRLREQIKMRRDHQVGEADAGPGTVPKQARQLVEHGVAARHGVPNRGFVSGWPNSIGRTMRWKAMMLPLCI
jgi:hypothetical protein